MIGKLNLTFVGILILTIQSCVVQKAVYTEDLNKNFNEQKEKFITNKRLAGDSINNFKVYYSDQTINRDYEVVSYNQVTSWIPFRPFVFKKWEVKYRLHQYMHNAYCLGLLQSIDAMIVDADLSGVKYIRYNDSKKNQFVKPGKQEYSRGVIGGLGKSLSGIINGGYFLNRDVNCLKSNRHEFGFLAGLNAKVETKISNIQTTNKDGGFFTLNYKYVYSYNISEYFSNTWNKRMKGNGLFTELGLDVNVLNTTNNSSKKERGDALISSDKTRITSLFGLGVYTGLKCNLNSNMSLNLGASFNPIGLGNFNSNKRSYQLRPDEKYNSYQTLQLNDFSLRVFLRVIYNL